jgi:hypothetical protein
LPGAYPFAIGRNDEISGSIGPRELRIHDDSIRQCGSRAKRLTPIQDETVFNRRGDKRRIERVDNSTPEPTMASAVALEMLPLFDRTGEKRDREFEQIVAEERTDRPITARDLTNNPECPLPVESSPSAFNGDRQSQQARLPEALVVFALALTIFPGVLEHPADYLFAY